MSFHNSIPRESDMIKGKPKTFLISDMHFGHELTLLFVPRMFESTHDMNVALANNWNETVGPRDIIWHLGDLKWTQRPFFWINKLQGKKNFIRGNHDNPRWRWLKRFAILRRGEQTFFLVHDPDDPYRVVPDDFNGWIIHGHHHGGRDKFENKYPFIDGINKRINVVAELINYRPVDLDWIVSLDLNTIKWMDTINDTPVRWGQDEVRPLLDYPRINRKPRVIRLRNKLKR